MGQERHIGHIVAGAWADLLLVDGDPTQDMSVLGDPARHIRLLMQGGRTVRNSLMG